MKKDAENALLILMMVILGGASIFMAITKNLTIKLILMIWHVLEAYILVRLLLLKIEKKF